MKVLFYSINNMWVPHFETELELMADHLAQGDDVFVLTCAGTLKACTSNPENNKTGCLKCVSRRTIGLQKVGVKTENNFTLKNTFTRQSGDTGVIPEFISSVAELKQYSWDGVLLGTCVASTLISELRDHQFDTLVHREKIQKNLFSSILIYESCLELVKKNKPDFIYIFNGRFADVYPAVAVARKLSITYFTHERGGNIGTYSLFKNNLPHTALVQIKQEIEDLWTSDNQDDAMDKASIGAQWFTDRRLGVEQAWISFSAQQEKKRLPEGFDTTKKNIVIFNSSIDEYDTFAEWEEPIYGDEIVAVKRILESCIHDKDMRFYFRVHPCLKNINNTQMKKLRVFADQYKDRIQFIWPEETIDSYALLEHSEKAIVFASTVGVEACYWGKPSILLGRAFYEDVDCCYIPKTHEQVIDLIQQPLAPKNQEHAIKYGYWETTRGITFKKFKPTGLFKGAFLDEEIKPKFGLKDRLLLKLYSRLDNFKLKTEKTLKNKLVKREVTRE